MTLDPRWRFCVAPMMEWTDRHCRFFHRLMSRRARLYSEMLTAGAILHGDRARLLGFSREEHPVALQVGGAEPVALARAARIGEDFGYDEINLNVGCPSDRVQGGRFGACLMREPALVADCIGAMKAAVRVPVTVKCRLGVDEQDAEEALEAMTRAVVAAGADALIVHARKAWLKGLSPKENRDVPPLDRARVQRLKRAWPRLPIIVNGGIASLAEAEDQLAHLDGVMLGRAAYHNPELLLGVDPRLFGEPAPVADGAETLGRSMPYVAAQLAQGVRLNHMTRHLLGLFQGRPGALAFRRHLTTEAAKAGAGLDVLRTALALVDGAEMALAA